MRTFILLWLGQFASSIGSGMTYFALTLWVWSQAQSATAIALILFFYQLPQIAIALFSGVLIDRVSRKRLLIVSDTASACCTLSVGVLAITQALQIWHLYLIAAILGCFSHIQTLTYTTIVPLLVPSQHHVRATSMGAIAGYSTGIFSPALAGVLYAWIGLFGITVIDMITFAVAIVILLFVSIPSARRLSSSDEQKLTANLWQAVTFGFRYIGNHPTLRTMMVMLSMFAFLNQMSEALAQPMVLAFTGGNAQILGTVAAASGMGGIIGGAILTLSGGFRDRILGMFVGMLGVGGCKLVFGLGQNPIPWIGARLGASISEPMIFSAYTAVWYDQVPVTLQGRVFAADHLIGLVVGAAASLIAGPLADRVFAPMMLTEHPLANLLEGVVGAGAGGGMAMLHTLCAIAMLCISLGGLYLCKRNLFS